MNMTACDDGASVWLLGVGGRTILFDTWLQDPYYAIGRWFFSAERFTPPLIPPHKLPALDLIVISSVEQDHCNPSTLRLLDRSTPIVTSRGVARTLRRMGFFDVRVLSPGEELSLFGGDVEILALHGYARNQPYVLRGPDGASACIAQHGIHFSWLQANLAGLRQRGWLEGPLEQLCVPAQTTLLKLAGVPLRWMPDGGVNMPAPEELVEVVSMLEAQSVFFTHCTPEREDGWASRNLIRFPHGARSVAHTLEVLRARCHSAHVLGKPIPNTTYTVRPS